MKLYGYVDFLKICPVGEEKENWFGYVIKVDGVWKIPPDDAMYRLVSQKELEAIFIGVTDHDFSKPVLPFPCTRQQLISFLRKTQLHIMLDPDSELLQSEGNAKGGKGKGGNSQGSLGEAVEHLYLKLQKQEKTDVLEKGNIQQFITTLRECLNESNPNFSDYIAERIEKIKNRAGRWIITTQERRVLETKQFEKKRKSQDYTPDDVSKILCTLRKKYPL